MGLCHWFAKRDPAFERKKKASERAGTLTSPPASCAARGHRSSGPRRFRPSLSFSLRFPPPFREEKTNKEEQIAGRRSASRTFPPRIQVAASILWGVARELPRGASGGRGAGDRAGSHAALRGGLTASATTTAAAAGWGGRGGSRRYRCRLPGGRPSPWKPATQGEGFITINGREPMKLHPLEKTIQPIE